MPKMTLCGNNHYYDSELHASCPHCKKMFVDGGKTSGYESTGKDEIKTSGKRGKTIAMGEISTKQGETFLPAVGWLVCVEGEDRGKDFRIHSDNNFVGRGSRCDVCLSDMHISEKHFVIGYDTADDDYFIYMDEGKAIVRVNDKRLGGDTLSLKKGDKIKVGETQLVFIPLESSIVKWG